MIKELYSLFVVVIALAFSVYNKDNTMIKISLVLLYYQLARLSVSIGRKE